MGLVDSLAEDTVRVDFELLRDAMQPLREHIAFIVVFVLSVMPERSGIDLYLLSDIGAKRQFCSNRQS